MRANVDQPAYTFYDEVRVIPRPGADPELEELRGQLGIVLGLPLHDDDTPYYYPVHIDPKGGQPGEVWELDEDGLVATGVKRPDPYAGGTTTSVSTDGTVLGSRPTPPPAT
jgi:hypothetical protein